MSLLKKLSLSFVNAMEMAGRAQTLNQLKTLNDHTLEDLGFSRALLEQGVSAWPWKTNQESAIKTASHTKTDSASIKAAIAELNAYNDKDLADIGLTRSDIREAVVHGRIASQSRAA